MQIGRDQGFSQSSKLGGEGLSYKDNDFRKLKFHFEKNKLIYGGLGLVLIVGLITLLS